MALPFRFVKKFIRYILRHKKRAVLALVVLGVAVFFLRPKPQTAVETQEIKKGSITSSVSVSGAIGAKSQADLIFGSIGKVVYLGAKKNDSVKVGQIIAQEDLRTVETNIQSAAKAYENQKISYDIVNDFNGDRNLSDTGLSISARRQLQTAVNTLDAAQLAVEIQRIAREQSILVSPINGVLVRADVDTKGTIGTTGTHFIIVDPSSLIFSIDVDEADIGKIKEGLPIDVVLDAYPDETLHLTVSSIAFVSHTSSTGGNAFTVEAQMPKVDLGVYRVGMNGNAEIILSKKSNVLTVPISAIYNDHFVYIKTQRGYKKQNITLGLQSDTDAEVTSGVIEGQQVVLEPSKVATK